MKTAVLLAGLQAEGRTTVREPRPEPRPHRADAARSSGWRSSARGSPASVRGRRARCAARDVRRARRRVERGLPGGGRARPARLRGAARRACCSPPPAPPSSRCCARWAAASRRGSSPADPEPVGSIVASLLDAARARRVDPALVAVADRRGAGARRGRGLRRGRAHRHRRRRAAGQGERPHRRPRRGARPPSGRGCASCRTASWSRAARRCAGPACAPTATTASRWRWRWPRWRAEGPTEIEGARVRGRLLPRVLRRPGEGHGPCLSRPARVVLVGLHGRPGKSVGRAARWPGGSATASRTWTGGSRGATGRSDRRDLPGAGEEAFRELEREEARALCARSAARGRGDRRRRLRPPRDAGAAPARARSPSGCGAISRPLLAPRPGRRLPPARREP